MNGGLNLPEAVVYGGLHGDPHHVGQQYQGRRGKKAKAEQDQRLSREAERDRRTRSEIVPDALSSFLRARDRQRFLDEIARPARELEPGEARSVAEDALPLDNEALPAARNREAPTGLCAKARDASGEARLGLDLEPQSEPWCRGRQNPSGTHRVGGFSDAAGQRDSGGTAYHDPGPRFEGTAACHDSGARPPARILLGHAGAATYP